MPQKIVKIIQVRHFHWKWPPQGCSALKSASDGVIFAFWPKQVFLAVSEGPRPHLKAIYVQCMSPFVSISHMKEDIHMRYKNWHGTWGCRVMEFIPEFIPVLTFSALYNIAGLTRRGLIKNEADWPPGHLLLRRTERVWSTQPKSEGGKFKHARIFFAPCCIS